MNCTKNTARTRFVWLMLGLLSLSGCTPQEPAKKADSDNATANTPNPDQASAPAPSPTEEAPKPTEEGVDGSTDKDLSTFDWESRVGEEVTIPGELVVVDNYDLARYGEVKVARKRLYVPTNTIDPNDADPQATSFEGGSNVAKVTQAQKINDAGTLILDDGLDKQNVFPPKLFPELGSRYPSVRVGSVLNGLSGTVVKKRNKIMLVPNLPLQWTPAERPKRPNVGNADVTVASFNVLNYFTTIDDGRNQARGADSESELKRQQDKLVSAILALQADVIGLMEIENNLEAEKRLVAALNESVGSEVFKGSALPEGFADAPGGRNAIRVGLIYRTDRVQPVGDISMIADQAFDKARTPLVQTFKSKTGTQPFTVVVNHFKSKGGSRGADASNKDQGDGQGGYNAARRDQALAICNYIKDQAAGGGKSRVLVIGDLNAYDQEDPIDLMRAEGLVNLLERVSTQPDESHYSFIYYGQCGALDHALATKALADDITGVATWHINADEPRFLDYNEEYNPQPLYESNPFRSSDHDPVLIGIGGNKN